MDLGLKPWHEYALNYALQYDERRILGIYDPEGNNIKTTFVKYLNYKGYANIVPSSCDTAKQIMEFVYGQEERNCYCFNIPRAMKQDGRALCKLFIAIETIKDGTIYDTRYKTQEKIIERPQIIVIFNDLMDLSMLSLDRWEFLELNQEYENGYKIKTAYDYNKPPTLLIEDEPAQYDKSSKSEISKSSKKKKKPER